MASDVKAGGAYVELLLRDQKFRTGLSKARAGLTSFARSAMAIAGPLLAAFSFKKMIDAASDLQETMNKFNVVFGENAAAVKKWSDEFSKEVGRSEKQVAEFMANSQDLFVPLGFEPGAAEAMSKQITGLAVDLASFNNMADEDAIRDLHAALTGSGEVMKKYGVVLSEAAVKQELVNTLGQTAAKNATNQQKVQARLNLILAGTTAAQGDAVRSGDSFANSMKEMQAAMSNLAADIGSIFLPMVTSMVSGITDIINWSRTMVDDVVAGWQWLQMQVGSVVGEITFAIMEWETLLQTAFVSAQLSVVQWGNTLTHWFTEVIPGYLSWFADNWRDVFTDIANMTKTIAGNIWENLKSLWDAIVGLFNGEGFNFEWTPLTQGFESAIKELPQIAERELSPLEQSLNAELNKIAAELVDKRTEFKKSYDRDLRERVYGPEAPEAVASPTTGAAEVANAARGAGGAAKEVFGAFSSAALAAQGGGDSTTSAVDKLRKEQAKQHKEMVSAVKEGGSLGS